MWEYGGKPIAISWKCSDGRVMKPNERNADLCAKNGLNYRVNRLRTKSSTLDKVFSGYQPR